LQTNQKSLEEISALFGDTVEHDPVSADGQNLSIFEDRGGDKAPVMSISRSRGLIPVVAQTNSIVKERAGR
jgi:hypothetical protein